MGTVQFTLNTCFSSGSLGLRRCWAHSTCVTSLRNQPPVRTPGTETARSFPRRKHFSPAVATCCWGISCVPYHFSGRGLLKSEPGFLWASLLLPFPFADFALHPSCDYMPHSWNPPSKSLSLGTVVGAADKDGHGSHPRGRGVL